MRSLGARVLKLLLLVGAALYIFVEFTEGRILLERIIFSFMIGGLAYLAVSLFGFALTISGNYLVAVLITLAIYVGAALGLTTVQEKCPWLSDGWLMVIIFALIALNVVVDILCIKTYMTAPKNPNCNAGGQNSER